MIEKYLGISSDYVIIGLAGLVLLTMILLIVFIVQMAKLKKRYKIFMQGNDAKSLEDTLVYRLEQVDELIEANASNERNIDMIFKNMKDCFQKIGLVKYDEHYIVLAVVHEGRVERDGSPCVFHRLHLTAEHPVVGAERHPV